jgi:hypothetical protein
MHPNLQQYIARFVQLTDKEAQIVSECLKFKVVPKKTVLLQAGEVCHFEAYLGITPAFLSKLRKRQMTIKD